MKARNLVALICTLCTLLPVSAIEETEAKKLLKSAEDNTAFYETDFSGVYSVVQKKPGEGDNINNAIMYRRDSQAKWTILITGPAKERGKGYLQYDGNIWFYDPADRRFTFTSSRDKFQNTNANNSDFAPQHYERDYNIKNTSEVKLGRYQCVLFELSAKDGVEVDYPTLKLWVTKDDGLMRKKEDFSLSGQKLRTTAVPRYQSIKGADGKRTYHIPVDMVIQDNLRGKKINGKMQYEQTVISISNVKFDKVDNSVYTKPYLEMMSIR